MSYTTRKRQREDYSEEVRDNKVVADLPVELLVEIFKYGDDYYDTLHSCILVNKQWYNFNIPALWKDPFYSLDSTKIIINCLLNEDKNFLTRENIKLTFELLDKPPLFNYAKFCTILCFYFINDNQFKELIVASGSTQLEEILRNKLVNFVLDHSEVIKEFSTFDLNLCLIYKHHRFVNCFNCLSKLDCEFSSESYSKFISKLAKICKSIQSIGINYIVNEDKEKEDSLARLILAQNKIKELIIINDNVEEFSDDDNVVHTTLSKNIKKAIQAHSQSIIYYLSNGENNVDCRLIPTLKNLKTLLLSNKKINYLEGVSLTKINCIFLRVDNNFSILQPDLSQLDSFIKFIENNGKTIKDLDLGGFPEDLESLSQQFESIAQNCKNLIKLSICYRNEMDQELIAIINNCSKLESIEFRNDCSNKKISCNKILQSLLQTTPRKLKIISFLCKVGSPKENLFDEFMNNWRGIVPFTIKAQQQNFTLEQYIMKYRDLGILN